MDGGLNLVVVVVVVVVMVRRRSGSLLYVLGQDILLTVYLFPPRCINGYQ